MWAKKSTRRALLERCEAYALRALLLCATWMGSGLVAVAVNVAAVVLIGSELFDMHLIFVAFFALPLSVLGALLAAAIFVSLCGLFRQTFTETSSDEAANRGGE